MSVFATCKVNSSKIGVRTLKKSKIRCTLCVDKIENSHYKYLNL